MLSTILLHNDSPEPHMLNLKQNLAQTNSRNSITLCLPYLLPNMKPQLGMTSFPVRRKIQIANLTIFAGAMHRGIAPRSHQSRLRPAHFDCAHPWSQGTHFWPSRSENLREHTFTRLTHRDTNDTGPEMNIYDIEGFGGDDTVFCNVTGKKAQHTNT